MIVLVHITEDIEVELIYDTSGARECLLILLS